MVKIALDAEDSGKEGVLGELVDGLQREQPRDDVSSHYREAIETCKLTAEGP